MSSVTETTSSNFFIPLGFRCKEHITSVTDDTFLSKVHKFHVLKKDSFTTLLNPFSEILKVTTEILLDCMCIEIQVSIDYRPLPSVPSVERKDGSLSHFHFDLSIPFRNLRLV